MLKTIFTILSIFSVYFILSQSTLLDKPRNWLIQKHPFFYELFYCPYCLTTHAGWLTYFLLNSYRSYNVHDLLLWVLASGPIGLIINGLVNKLYREVE